MLLLVSVKNKKKSVKKKKGNLALPFPNPVCSKLQEERSEDEA